MPSHILNDGYSLWGSGKLGEDTKYYWSYQTNRDVDIYYMDIWDDNQTYRYYNEGYK